MSKQRILMAIVMSFALMGIVVAAHADGKRQQKPDSIVLCRTALNPSQVYFVAARTAPASVNLDQCSQPSDCSPCVRSLENQGCKIVDVVTDFPDHLPLAGASYLGRRRTAGFGTQTATFLLSCEKP